MEIKKHAIEQPMGQRKKHKRNLKISGGNENVNKLWQNVWDSAKEVLREKIAWI